MYVCRVGIPGGRVGGAGWVFCLFGYCYWRSECDMEEAEVSAVLSMVTVERDGAEWPGSSQAQRVKVARRRGKQRQ